MKHNKVNLEDALYSHCVANLQSIRTDALDELCGMRDAVNVIRCLFWWHKCCSRRDGVLDRMNEPKINYWNFIMDENNIKRCGCVVSCILTWHSFKSLNDMRDLVYFLLFCCNRKKCLMFVKWSIECESWKMKLALAFPYVCFSLLISSSIHICSFYTFGWEIIWCIEMMRDFTEQIFAFFGRRQSRSVDSFYIWFYARMFFFHFWQTLPHSNDQWLNQKSIHNTNCTHTTNYAWGYNTYGFQFQLHFPTHEWQHIKWNHMPQNRTYMYSEEVFFFFFSFPVNIDILLSWSFCVSWYFCCETSEWTNERAFCRSLSQTYM